MAALLWNAVKRCEAKSGSELRRALRFQLLFYRCLHQMWQWHRPSIHIWSWLANLPTRVVPLADLAWLSEQIHEPFANADEKSPPVPMVQGPDTAMIYLAISTSECATVALAWFFDSGIFCDLLLRFASLSRCMWQPWYFLVLFTVLFVFAIGGHGRLPVRTSSIHHPRRLLLQSS